MLIALFQILRGVPMVSPPVQETGGTGETPIAEEEAKADDETKGLRASALRLIAASYAWASSAS